MSAMKPHVSKVLGLSIDTQRWKLSTVHMSALTPKMNSQLNVMMEVGSFLLERGAINVFHIHFYIVTYWCIHPLHIAEPYVCTGKFHDDLAELCSRANMTHTPGVVNRARRPGTPPPPPEAKPEKGTFTISWTNMKIIYIQGRFFL